MSSINRRIVSILLVLLLGAEMLHVGFSSRPGKEQPQEARPLVFWYTDQEIQGYVEQTAAEFSRRRGVEVQTELVSEVDYLEQISAGTMAEEMSGPDAYVLSSAQLEKASLSGLAKKVEGEDLEKLYSRKAAEAVSCHGAPAAWPFYIETCFLLYNRHYVQEAPETIDQILLYAENFQADQTTERVENIFKWNVDDVVDNYLFLGAYMDLGGPSGDDKNQVSMDREKVEQCMAYYQSLNSFFAIDADTVSSQEVIQEFIDGKTVFTLVNVPMLRAVDQAVWEGALPEYASEQEPFYGAAPLPELTEELKTRGISVTSAVAVNPYSSDPETAEEFARYLTAEAAGSLYEEAGKLPASRDRILELPGQYETVYQAYEEAAEVPKLMELSNIWLHLEKVLADIWRGADASAEISGFSELLERQLNRGA